MEKIILEPTELTPGVKLDAATNRYEMWGESRPENARKFYQPILDWFDQLNKELYYLKSEAEEDVLKRTVEVKFSFDYLNSTSIKFVYELLKKISELKTNCSDVLVTWMYEPGDEDMKESGEEYSNMVDVKFNIKSK